MTEAKQLRAGMIAMARLSFRFLPTCVLLLLVSHTCDARNWKSDSGTFNVEASFVALSKGTVVLRRDDNGKQIHVPMAKLHVDDQKWIMEKTGWGRVWESNDGKKVIADFKSADDKTVTLERRDGSLVTIAISRFSRADQAYIKSRAAADAVNRFDSGDQFSGKVVSVSDGDTVTVLCQKQQVKVWLPGIDAPEKGPGSEPVSKI